METEDSISVLQKDAFPALLKEITDPPERLFVQGVLPSDEHKFLCVVGSRKYSQYGKDVCERIVEGCAGYPVVIVSGLAIGIDAIAHRAALNAELPTVAIPGSGLNENVIYPRAHVGLAREIVKKGGALMTEFEPDMRAAQWSFPQRNRLMAGMSHAVLVIEATERSGTLITARLASDYNRDLLTVPASVFSHHARGSNRLLREGAIAVTSGDEVLQALGFSPEIRQNRQRTFENLSADEQKIVSLLKEPTPRDELIRKLNMPISTANILLSALEVKDIVEERFGEMRLR